MLLHSVLLDKYQNFEITFVIFIETPLLSFSLKVVKDLTALLIDENKTVEIFESENIRQG